MTAEVRTQCSFIGRDAGAANSDRLEKGKTFYGLKNNLITYETRSLFETRKRVPKANEWLAYGRGQRDGDGYSNDDRLRQSFMRS